MNKLKCSKCGYMWYPKDPNKEPKECPNCKNRSWNNIIKSKQKE